ncbi:methyltransferase domain-containing protein [Glycomyces sp. L485]|uniref:methyltransferase n=1 Tax=Glycomyces sp. L485 TaxID=2909235 RepID=UPI001F4BAA19|nr:methyltransferase [Glycomyces sp. L485]MCH7231753.1 methyltransferase domain-containing protein [Glycomyces sp. L485]
MKPATAKRLLRPRNAVPALACAAAAAMPLALPLGPALFGSGLTLLAFAAICGCDVIELRRLSRDIALKRRASALLRVRAGQTTTGGAMPGDLRRLERVGEALAGGFPDSAAEEALAVASRTRVPASDRLAALRTVVDWHRRYDSQSPETRRSRFDVVFISHLGLQGGNTSTNAAEIRVCRDLGLKVGLLHHPIYKWGPNAPLHPRVEELVNGKSVSLIGLDDAVECDLAVVRLPTVLVKPLERRPRITAGNTVVVANQTPFKFYGTDEPREEAWDVAAVERNVTEWLGRPTWYPGGPNVRATLLEHHAEEIAGLDVASELWNETIEVGQWRLDGRRSPDGRIRIGRHSRDHLLKWPEDPETLLRCYPDREPFEIHVLGGAETPTRILGSLPSNWTVHAFNDLSARDFLAQIDIMAYFISTDGLEAFGRAPLEAMAAGVPVVMDRRFEPTFGPAAVYCEPDEVASVAERLCADPEAHAAQQSAAWKHLTDHFSARVLVERLSQSDRGGRLSERLEYTPARYWDRRYRDGRDSGEGSRGDEGSYKARFVSDLIKEREIDSLIDWGCGDGQVLAKVDLHGASYTGVDVSETIVERMRERFSERPNYSFDLPSGVDLSDRRDLALSMDVLFHLPSDVDYDAYLSRLFGSAGRHVLVYSTDYAGGQTAPHVRRREFTADVAKQYPEWKLVLSEPPLAEGLASFFLYERVR